MRLGRSAARGLLLASGVNFGTYIFSFGVSVLLARLLTPNEFGQIALATTIADLLFLTVGLSLPTALLREPAATVQIACRTSMTMMAAASVGLAAVGAAISFGLASWMSETVALLFATVVISRIPPLFALCLASDIQRRNAYGGYSIVVYGSQALSLVVALVLGLLGAGVWALAAREVAAGLCLLILAVWFSEWRIRFGFDGAKCVELLKFGVLMLGSRMGDILFHRYDNLVVGTMAGTRQLGLYNQAYVLAEMSNKVYAPVIYQVPQSIYAQLQGDSTRTTLMYQLMMFAIIRSVLPLALVLVVFPSEVLGFVFGAQWTPAAEMLRALAVYTLLLPVFEHARVLLVANGDVTATLRARAFQLAVFLPATPLLTLAYGARGAAIAVAGSMVVGTLSILRQAQRLAAFRFADCAAPLMAAVFAAGAGIAIGHYLSGDLSRLAAGTATTLGVYAVMLIALERKRLLMNTHILRSYFRETPVDTPIVPAPPPTTV